LDAYGKFSVRDAKQNFCFTIAEASDNRHSVARLWSPFSSKWTVPKNNMKGVRMVGKEPVCFDPETISALKEILDEAWNRLPAERQATMLKTTLAERLLKTAAEGERNRDRLLDVVLRELAA